MSITKYFCLELYCDNKNCISSNKSAGYSKNTEKESLDAAKKAGWVLVGDKCYCKKCASILNIN